MAADESKQVEIAAVIREIQDRVRARYPIETAGSSHVPLPDLTPLLHARDRAEGTSAVGWNERSEFHRSRTLPRLA